MPNFKPVKVVIVGCGMIAEVGYQPRCQAYPQKIELVGYYDQDINRAKLLAEKGGGKVYHSLDEVLNDPGVEGIINLTIHTSHYPVSLAGLKAGKHVYSEKPVALRVEEADEMVETADQMNVKFACAPVAMLGYVQQSVWGRIRNGEIGEVVSAMGNFGGPLEYWHPNADLFMMEGVGPFKDVAPYPLTAMTTMIGPVKRVYGLARITIPERMLHAGSRAGSKYQVTEKDHGIGLLEFESGAYGLLYHSWTARSELPAYEIHGTKGCFSIQAHDDGRGIQKSTPTSGWESEDSPEKAYTGLDWGKGPSDFADAIRHDRPVRCSGKHARHVLEICERVFEAADKGIPVEVKSRFPAPTPVGDPPPWS